MAFSQKVGHLQEKVNGHVKLDGASTVSVRCQLAQADREPHSLVPGRAVSKRGSLSV